MQLASVFNEVASSGTKAIWVRTRKYRALTKRQANTVAARLGKNAPAISESRHPSYRTRNVEPKAPRAESSINMHIAPSS